MGFINLADKTISAKLVYYGCGNGGKTTSLEAVHQIMRPEVDLVSIKTEEEATLLFDFLPIDLGEVNGFKIRLQGFTVPGQPKYERMRKYVLSGADAVVFVIDSERSRYEENLQSWESLRQNLASNGLSRDVIPLVLQYNKRDLHDVLSEAELDRAFRPNGEFEAFPSVATAHSGVFEVFVHAAGLLVEQKVRDYDLGKGRVDPHAVADGARQRLWEIFDEIRGPRHHDTSDEHRLELTFDYDLPELASADEIASLASGSGELLTDDDLEIDLGDVPGVERVAEIESPTRGPDSADAEGDDWQTLLSPQALPPGGFPNAAPPPDASEEDARIDAAALQSSYELARKLGEAQQYAKRCEDKLRDLVKHTENIVHDLKKPVSVLRLMFKSVQKGLFGDAPPRVISAIENGSLAVGSMERLISDLLDSSRLDFDGVEMTFGEVDMTLLLGQLATGMRYAIDEGDAVLQIEPLPVIRGDEWALEKAFGNLLGNALQYTDPDRRPRIQISCDRDGDRHVFRVQDNGIGIPAGEVRQIFERFERGSNVASIAGTGLGMHIVREIALGHGGDAWVDSEEGVGTSVYLAIPLDPVQPPHSAV